MSPLPGAPAPVTVARLALWRRASGAPRCEDPSAFDRLATRLAEALQLLADALPDPS